MRVVQRVSPFVRHFIRVENFTAWMMIGVGWSLTFRPESPLGQFIASYLMLFSVTNQAFGLFILCCAIAVAQGPAHGNFILLTTPFLAFIVFSILYFLVTPNVGPSYVFMYSGTYGLMLCHYFTRHPSHESHRRSDQ